jgi:hypothetical protein
MDRPFKVLTEDEYQRLTTDERAAYLRQAVDALEELKSQLRRAIMFRPDAPAVPVIKPEDTKS